MLESKFQKQIKDELTKTYPGIIILKNDPTYKQGFPDLLCLYNNKWVALETKRHKNASKRPNQEYYIDKLRTMSYAAFIEPENKEEVFNEIQHTFRT